jgi:hypothetical protein
MDSVYATDSRSYLARALGLLKEDRTDGLFYAALELRCGIEARLQEYLDVQQHLSKKRKEGWRIAELGAKAARVFRTGDKVARFRFFEEKTKTLVAELYYTPVTHSARKASEKLGNYLHAAKKYHPPDDAWWQTFRQVLHEAALGLLLATKGTLLGLPLISPSRQMAVYTEKDELPFVDIGTTALMEVEYLDEFPGFDPGAVTWTDIPAKGS